MEAESFPAGPEPSDQGQVIRHVSQCLSRLIRAHIAELRNETAVVFDSPAEYDNQDETRLSLFLYQVNDNPWLRNLPPTMQYRPGNAGGGAALSQVAPPLVVDLLYVVVPFARTVERELVLIDKLVRVFHAIPALQGRWLDPVLRQAGNESIEIVPTTGSPETLSHIWSNFQGRPYKLTKLYTLSPVRLPVALEYEADMVGHADLEAVSLAPPSGLPPSARGQAPS